MQERRPVPTRVWVCGERPRAAASSGRTCVGGPKGWRGAEAFSANLRNLPACPPLMRATIDNVEAHFGPKISLRKRMERVC